MTAVVRRRKPGFRARRRSEPGEAPGTVLPDPSQPAAHITLTTYGGGTFSEATVAGPGDLPEPGGDKVNWIDVVGLGDAELIREIGRKYGLHRLALEDVVHVHQRPKVEDYGDHLFIVFRMVAPGARAGTEQISMFVGTGFVITFQEREGDSFGSVRARLRMGRGIVRGAGADYLSYALIDAALDDYFPLLETYDDRLDDLTEEVLRRPDPVLVEELHEIKRDLFELRRVVWASREMLNALIRDRHAAITDDTRTYVRDAYDHCIQLMDMLEMLREVSASLFDIYLSSLSNRLNEIMKMLTMIATIFIPLGFVASVYGMNFEYMPELKWPWGYPMALAMMAAVAFGLLLWFRRRGWIGTRRRKTVRRELHRER